MSFVGSSSSSRLTFNVSLRCTLDAVRAEHDMSRMKPAILLFAFAGGSGGQYDASGDVSNNDALAKITYEVLGMMKAKSGAT